MERHSILIVEDDLLSAEYLKALLQKAAYEVSAIVNTAEAAIEKCRTEKPDAVLMDIMLKGVLSGSEAAIEIKREHPEIRIIFLTAYAEPEMVDYAARSKACAYLMKPYREQEILATLQVSLMQAQPMTEDSPEAESSRIRLKHDFVFDSRERRLYKQDKEIPLSSKKLRLVELLARNRDHFISNEQICLYVWNDMKSNSTLRSLIHRFRALINEDIITNVNGVGYSIHTR